jgi:hypothetical protein
MSGFDRFLKDIGAITATEGTTADVAIPEVIKRLRTYLQQLAKSPNFSCGMDFDLVQESLRKADLSVVEGDFERAYLHTLDAVLHLGYAAKATEPIEGLEAVLNQALDEAHQSVR